MSDVTDWPSIGAQGAYDQWAAKTPPITLDDTAKRALSQLESAMTRTYSVDTPLAYAEACWAAQVEVQRLVDQQ